jgi:AcrR family transcriptional regulator
MTRPRKKANLAAARARMYHELVFDSAERVFAEGGFTDSTMQDLAAEAGISLKTLYATFPGKDDIYREILSVRAGGLADAIREAAASDGTPLERLRAGIHSVVSYLVEHRAFFQILLQEGKAWGLNPRGEQARDAWNAGLGVVGDVLADGMKDGEFLDGDPALLSPTVNAVLQVQLAGLLSRSKNPDPDEISDTILVTLRRMLCGSDRPARKKSRAA